MTKDHGEIVLRRSSQTSMPDQTSSIFEQSRKQRLRIVRDIVSEQSRPEVAIHRVPLSLTRCLTMAGLFCQFLTHPGDGHYSKSAHPACGHGKMTRCPRMAGRFLADPQKKSPPFPARTFRVVSDGRGGTELNRRPLAIAASALPLRHPPFPFAIRLSGSDSQRPFSD